LSVALAALLPLAPVSGQSKQVAEEFNAIYTNISNVGTVGALPVVIRIRRWTGQDEHVQLMRILEQKGNDEFVRALQDAKSVGSIGRPQDLPYDLRYARQEVLPEGGRRIVLMTDRPMSAWERLSGGRTRDYSVAWIDIKLDGEGRGEGTMSVATRLKLIGDVLGIEDLANQPAKLSEIKKVK
jgi:hypothetical protein